MRNFINFIIYWFWFNYNYLARVIRYGNLEGIEDFSDLGYPLMSEGEASRNIAWLECRDFIATYFTPVDVAWGHVTYGAAPPIVVRRPDGETLRETLTEMRDRLSDLYCQCLECGIVHEETLNALPRGYVSQHIRVNASAVADNVEFEKALGRILDIIADALANDSSERGWVVDKGFTYLTRTENRKLGLRPA